MHPGGYPLHIMYGKELIFFQEVSKWAEELAIEMIGFGGLS